jgi:hypothetical protein
VADATGSAESAGAGASAVADATGSAESAGAGAFSGTADAAGTADGCSAAAGSRVCCAAGAGSGSFGGAATTCVVSAGAGAVSRLAAAFRPRSTVSDRAALAHSTMTLSNATTTHRAAPGFGVATGTATRPVAWRLARGS